MVNLSRDVFTLSAGQALTSTVVSLLTSVSSLSGAYLAPFPSLSTVPVTATVLGALLMIYPASTIMGRLGRRGGFVFKAIVGTVGGTICFLALLFGSFTVLVVGTFTLGVFSAFGQYYRFAALDAARSSEQRGSAIAIVTAGGVVGGIAGPFLAAHFSGLLPSVPYAGAFIALSATCVVLAASQMLLSASLGRNDKPAARASTASHGFTLSADFMRASAVCAVGFSVMTLTMNATPLSLKMCGFNVHDSSIVLQTHFLLMYLPSLFNPFIIKFVGFRGLSAIGVLMSALGCTFALVTDQTLFMYAIELGLSGLAWNFMFNGGTLLLADTYPAAHKNRAQGINSLLVYSANIAASLLAGVLLSYFSWQFLNAVCFPVLLVAALCLLPKKSEKQPILRSAQ